MPRREYPIGPSYQVDPYNDMGSRGRREGKWVGAMPASTAGRIAIAAGPGGGSCSYAIDCDDGDPCTTDFCDLAPGGAAGSGTCMNTPVADGQPGDCDDGCFCTGDETCSGNSVFLCEGTCAGGPNMGLPCQTSAANTGCPDSFCQNLTCQGGPMNSNSCTYTQECSTGGGVCVAGTNPCSGGDSCNEALAQRLWLIDPSATLDPDNFCENCGANDSSPGNACDDGLQCNGLEQCLSGICVVGTPPCGPSADCYENQCAQVAGCTLAEGCAFAPCVSDLDCNGVAGACQPTTPGSGVDRDGCFYGRCCTGLTCTKEQSVNCAADWYAGDNGRVSLAAACPRCPLYNAGIGNQGDFTVVAGPTSLSPANNIMSGAPLHKLGDDYNFCGSGDYMSLEFMRFVGGIKSIANARVSIEFYDASGVFVEDVFIISNTHPSQIAVQRVDFLAPLTIPCQGFVVAHVLQAFAGNVVDTGELFWVATDAVDQGSNATGTLYTEEDLNWTPASPPQPVANFLKRCQGNGKPCSVGTNCPSGVCVSRNNDVLAFELEGEIVAAPLGICCDDGTPGCNKLTQWECEAAGGRFLGLGGTCYTCDLASSNPGDPCETCAGGINVGMFCDSDVDCPGSTCDPDNGECFGGGSCAVNEGCGAGACCLDATGECVESVSESTCTGLSGTFQGYGTDCELDCCPQPIAFWTGRDNCEEAGAVTTILAVPCIVDADCGNNPDSGHCNISTGECVVTITGDNSSASNIPLTCNGGTNDGASCVNAGDCPGGSCDGNPDSCFPPSAAPGGELGWWEAFQFVDCAYVRIDHCCTDPVKIPAYRVLYDSCPCGSAIFTKRDPNVPDEPSHGRGNPYCDDDNAWSKFGPLRAGAYYYPVQSRLGGDFDAYQLHVTAKPCPNAACCYSACSNSSNTVCTTDGDCFPGESCIPQDGGASPSFCQDTCNRDSECGAGTCDSSCSLMNILECQDIGGAFLAPPNKSTATVVCFGGVCDTGSCCTGPGECEDEILGTEITKEDCTNVFDGKYVGGFKCFGGECSGGPRDGLSCQTTGQCAPGGTCIGDQADLAQPSPCPVCEIASADNCQFFDNSVHSRLSDLTLGYGSRTAEDFIPDADVINTVCVWGAYTQADALGNVYDCANDVNDDFKVTVYYPDADGVPDIGNIAGSSTVSGANVAKATVPSALEDLTQVGVYAYQLTLDTAIILNAGDPNDQIYWIEVTNDVITSPDSTCAWSWMGTDSMYNDYSASGTPGGYVGLKTGDLAFCLDTNFQAPDPYLRQCCDCSEACTLKTKRDCESALSSFDVTNDSCAACSFLPVPEDNCVDVIGGGSFTGNVTINFDNTCANTDGPNPVASEWIDGTVISNDLWYKYTSAVNGTITFNTCAGGSDSLDSVIAIYDGTPGICPTASTTKGLLIGGQSWDESCDGLANGGGGLVSIPAQVGDVFLVRVGTSAGTSTGGGIASGSTDIGVTAAAGSPNPPRAGKGALTISEPVIAPFCGDNVVNQASEECDGSDDSNCPGVCQPDCTCGCVCTGDVTGDGQANFSDVSVFVNCWIHGICLCTSTCDANCDGDINDCDLQVILNTFFADPLACAHPCGACCIDGTTCAYTTQDDCETPPPNGAGGVFLGGGSTCPTQQAAIVPEGNGTVFVHVIGPPVDCLNQPVVSIAQGPCPPSGPYIDAWKSPADALMCHNFGSPDTDPILAGFFDSGSDQYDGVVCLEGVSLNATGFGEADTLIERSDDPFDRCSLPQADSATVDIEIVALSMHSVDPITVTHNGGQSPAQWDVAVDLSPGTTPIGTLTARRTSCNGGTYTSTLLVQPRFTFTKVGEPGEVRVLDTRLAGTPPVTLAQLDPHPWVSDLDPALGATVDPCTHFHANVKEPPKGVDCDCNGNGRRDACDIEEGTSLDLDANGVPDECLCESGSAQAALAEPAGLNKSRTLSFMPENAGANTAIRVTLVSLDGFSELNSEVRWVGPATEQPDTGTSTFTAARLQCEPYFADWGTMSSLLHVSGPEIIPNSMYEVSLVRQICTGSEVDPGGFSAPLAVNTAKWGDVVAPFGGPAQPNFADITAVVDAFKDVMVGAPVPNADLVGPGDLGTPNSLDWIINFRDISADVDAFKGVTFSFVPSLCP